MGAMEPKEVATVGIRKRLSTVAGFPPLLRVILTQRPGIRQGSIPQNLRRLLDGFPHEGE